MGLGGCLTAAQRTPVPVFVDNRDDARHDVRISVSNVEVEDAFNTQVSVDGGELLKVAEVESDGFCLDVDVLELENGILSECPSAGDSDFSASGIAIIITSEPNDEGYHWVIEPIRNHETSNS